MPELRCGDLSVPLDAGWEPQLVILGGPIEKGDVLKLLPSAKPASFRQTIVVHIDKSQGDLQRYVNQQREVLKKQYPGLEIKKEETLPCTLGQAFVIHSVMPGPHNLRLRQVNFFADAGERRVATAGTTIDNKDGAAIIDSLVQAFCQLSVAPAH